MLLLQGIIPPPPKNMTLCVIGRVRFERNCGKMYSRHLFPYGRLLIDAMATRTSLKKKNLPSLSLHRNYSYPLTLSNAG